MAVPLLCGAGLRRHHCAPVRILLSTGSPHGGAVDELVSQWTPTSPVTGWAVRLQPELGEIPHVRFPCRVRHVILAASTNSRSPNTATPNENMLED